MEGIFRGIGEGGMISAIRNIYDLVSKKCHISVNIFKRLKINL
jgi:hypothetical protein